MIVKLDNVVLKSKEDWTPLVFAVVRRIQQRHRIERRTRASGILLGAGGNVHFYVPVLDIHTTGTNQTETLPTDASNMIIEVWGGGGGAGTIGGGHTGGGGGGGGRAISSIAIQTASGKTVTWTVGPGGAARVDGTDSTVVSGTFSLTTMTGSHGTAGTNGTVGGPGTDGSGGTAAGGTTSNTTGHDGLNGVGGAGLGGTVSGDGAPYGGGGSVNNGSGSNGAVVFYFT